MHSTEVEYGFENSKRKKRPLPTEKDALQGSSKRRASYANAELLGDIIGLFIIGVFAVVFWP